MALTPVTQIAKRTVSLTSSQVNFTPKSTQNIFSKIATQLAVKIFSCLPSTFNQTVKALFDRADPGSSIYHGTINYCNTLTKETRVPDDVEELIHFFQAQNQEEGNGVDNLKTKTRTAMQTKMPLTHPNKKNGSYTIIQRLEGNWDINHEENDQATTTKAGVTTLGDVKGDPIILEMGVRIDSVDDDTKQNINNILNEILANPELPQIPKKGGIMEGSLDRAMELFKTKIADFPELAGKTIKVRIDLTRTSPVRGGDINKPKGKDHVTLGLKETFTLEQNNQAT